MLSPAGLPTRHIGLDGQARPHTSTPARAAQAASTLSGSPSWLLGSVTREEMNAKLALMGLQDGQFLVRTLPLSIEECRYVFAIVYKGKPTHHNCAKAPNGIFMINNKRYGEPRSLGELVATLSAAELPSGWPVRLIADRAGSSSSLPALDLHSAAVLLFDAPKLRSIFADLVMERLTAAGMRSLAPADIQATLFLTAASLVLRYSGEFMLVKPDDTPAVHDYVICDVSNDNPIVGTRYHKIDADYDLCEIEFLKLPEESKCNFEIIRRPGERAVAYANFLMMERTWNSVAQRLRKTDRAHPALSSRLGLGIDWLSAGSALLELRATARGAVPSPRVVGINC